MRPDSEYQEALSLIKAGVNDCEVGRRLNIPRGTVRSWRNGMDGTSGRSKGRSTMQKVTCFRCDSSIRFDKRAYAYLLGAYLGDGCISEMRRGVYSLRITCDLKYPGIIHEIAMHMIIVRAVDKVGFTPAKGCVVVQAYWKHWPCVFPQHGPGKKHTRRIELAPWQQEIVSTHPQEMIRGLIQTDGTRHINEVQRPVSGQVKRYRYPRYIFTNHSDDIRRIFTDALDELGVHWTRTTRYDISVARRADVAYLDTFVGPKA